jgi:hypothetical protein
VRFAAIALACASLVSGGFAASYADADNPPLPPPSTTAGSAMSLPGDFVSNLVVICNSAYWRVGFALALPARVSGRIDVRQSSTRWALVRRVAARSLSRGEHRIELGVRSRGTYRVRLVFQAASRAPVVHTLVFRAGCRQNGPPGPPLTLPDDPNRA